MSSVVIEPGHGWRRMRRAASILGWIALVLATGLVLLGILAWPPGGLMFALPFFFLIPGVILGLIGLLLLWIGRRASKTGSS